MSPSEDAQHGSQKLTVTIVVAGQSTTHDYAPAEPLRAAVHRVLGETKNEGDISRWLLTLDGRELSLDATFAEAGVADGAALHLNIRRGAGASRRDRR